MSAARRIAAVCAAAICVAVVHPGTAAAESAAVPNQAADRVPRAITAQSQAKSQPHPTAVAAYFRTAKPSVREYTQAWLDAGAGFAMAIGATPVSSANETRARRFAFPSAAFDGDNLSDVMLVTSRFDRGIETTLEARRGYDGRVLFTLEPEMHEPTCEFPCSFSSSFSSIRMGTPVGPEGRPGVLVVEQLAGITSAPGVFRADLALHVTYYGPDGTKLHEMSRDGVVTETPAGAMVEHVPVAHDLLDAAAGEAADVLFSVEDVSVAAALAPASVQLHILDGRDGAVSDLGDPWLDVPVDARFSGTVDADRDGFDEVLALSPEDDERMKWSARAISPVDGHEVWTNPAVDGNTFFNVGDVSGDGGADLAFYVFLVDFTSDGEVEITMSENATVVDGRSGRTLRTLPLEAANFAEVDGDDVVDLHAVSVNEVADGHAVTVSASTFAGRPLYRQTIRFRRPEPKARLAHYEPGDVTGDGITDLVFTYFREVVTTVKGENFSSTTTSSVPLTGSIVSGATGLVVRSGVRGVAAESLDGDGVDFIDDVPRAGGRDLHAFSGDSGRPLWRVATSATEISSIAGAVDDDACADVVIVTESASGVGLAVLSGADGHPLWAASLDGTAPVVRGLGPRQRCGAGPAGPPVLARPAPGVPAQPLPATGGLPTATCAALAATGAVLVRIGRRRRPVLSVSHE